MINIDFKLKGKCGIYSIFNMSNGKRYIGSSVDLYNRLHEHYHNLRNNKSHNKHLQAAWDKYTEANFIVNVLEFCEPEERFVREQFYLDMLSPEYNFACLVTANLGRDISKEQREKISNTLKKKYASGELKPYIRKDALKECWIYNINTWKLVAYCKTFVEASKVLSVDRETISSEKIKGRIYKGHYVIFREPFKYVSDLKNFVYENFFKAKTKNTSYILTLDDSNNMVYYRSFEQCSKIVGVNAQTLRNHIDSTIDKPYVKDNIKYFVSDTYIPIIETAVPIEQSSELLLDNIGEPPEMENTEINSEITKGSESSLSIESE